MLSTKPTTVLVLTAFARRRGKFFATCEEVLCFFATQKLTLLSASRKLSKVHVNAKLNSTSAWYTPPDIGV